jgi:hypothetical protein
MVGKVGFLLSADAAERALLQKNSDVCLDKQRKAAFHFGKWVQFWGIPPPPWSIGIIELGEHLRQNFGAQQLRGKILSRKDLGPAGQYLLILLSLWR